MDISAQNVGVYLFGPFRLDPVRRTLLRDGTRVSLAPRLFDTLLYLVANHDGLAEKTELLAAVWGRRAVEDANLSQAIFALRRALQSAGASDTFIVTVPGRGYRLGVPVVFESAPQDHYASTPDAMPGVHDACDAATEAPSPPGPGLFRASLASLALAAAGLLAWHFVVVTRPTQSVAPTFAPPPHSVAIMAFTNLSGDPAQEYFSDGLAEELIDALGRVHDLRVPARLSSFSFKGRQVAIGDIARQLNVRAVLEGSVRRDTTKLRISARLIDGTTGYQIWSHEYDRVAGDVLKIEDDIAASVITSLKGALLNDDGPRLTLGGTTNAAALDAYLRGLKLDYETSNEADREAFRQFSAAVSLDPNFALAHVQRAFSFLNMVEFGAVRDAAAAHAMLGQALADADIAISLAPDLGSAHEARAGVLLDRDLDFAGAGREYTQARDLEGGNPWIQMKYGLYQLYVGHTAPAVAAAEAGISLDPVNGPLYLNLAELLFFARRYGDANTALRHAAQFGGTSVVRGLGLAGLTAVLTGDAHAATISCAPAQDIIETECLILADHALGRQQEAMSLLEKLHAVAGELGAYNYSEIYASWGRPEDALQWLQAAYKLHDTGLIFLKVDPFLDSIRESPQYKDIERRMNFPT